MMKWTSLLSVLLVNVCLANENHPPLFLKKDKAFSSVEFNDGKSPGSIVLRGGSTSKISQGVLLVRNDAARENPNARPVVHFRDVPDELICHMRIKLDGKSYKPKNPWLDVGGLHRNHFSFNEKEVIFSSEEVELMKRKNKMKRTGNLLPLNEWLYVTIEMQKGKLGLSINGKTQIYEDPNIEIGKGGKKIGMKAICGGTLHIDYIRVWNIK